VPVATAAAVRAQIAAGETQPIYLLQGEDDVEKSALAHEFETLVDEGIRAFNVERVHAGDLSSGDKLAAAALSLIDAVRTLPMMAPRRIVLVFQADGLLIPKRESEAAQRAVMTLLDAGDEALAAPRDDQVDGAVQARQHQAHGANIDSKPNLKRWFEELSARPAIKAMVAKQADIKSSRETATEDNKDRFFNRGKYARA